MRRNLVISSATRFVPKKINTLADIVCGRTSDFDLALEDPDRFFLEWDLIESDDMLRWLGGVTKLGPWMSNLAVPCMKCCQFCGVGELETGQ
jgi:hypothetical protein